MNNIEQYLPFIIGLPLAGAIVNGLAGRFADRRLVAFTAVGSVLAAFGVALFAFIELVSRKDAGTSQALTVQLWEWFRISLPSFDGGFREVPIQIGLVFDSLSGLMTLVVTGIGSLIHIYSLGYMSEDKSYSRFFTYLNLFTASMLILVLGSSFPVLFVGWEGVGLCSYLLIGFWYENSAYAQAGKKAFVANRIGDLGVIIGMFALVSVAGSFEFSAINAAAPEMVRDFNLGGVAAGSVATFATLFLFLGCTGKSAQIPLFVWLPDAMAGPTPVSALIHAATMVTAGVYLCCRLSPVFLQSATTLAVIAVVGACTAFVAATIAVVQNEMKKILAYSTVSQLGFMFAAVGVGAFAASFFHVFTHAFFKACLFLGAGSVMHAVHAHGDADIRFLGGMKKWMPITRMTFLVSCIAIAGIPPFSGFFSKDEILLGAAEVALHETMIPQWVGWFVLVVLSISAFLTAFYMFRLYFLTFSGDYRSAPKRVSAEGLVDGERAGELSAHGVDGAHGVNAQHAMDVMPAAPGYSPHPHESEPSMTFPLLVLGAGAVVVGFVGLPHHFLMWDLSEYSWWGHWLEPSLRVLEPAGEDHLAGWVAMGLGLAVAVSGLALAWFAYGGKNADTFTTRLPAGVRRFFFDKWRVDELYDATIIGFNKKLAYLSGRIDSSFVDTVLTRMASRGVQAAGWLATRAQVGRVHAYGFAIAIGIALMTWFVLYPHPSLEVETDNENAVLMAGQGPGYEYRWDLNSDGTFDVPAQPVRLRIDLVDHATDEQIIQVVNVTSAVVAPGTQRADRSALGRLIDRGHRIYELRPEAGRLEPLVSGLERLEAVESVEVVPDAQEVAFGNAVRLEHAFTEAEHSGYALIVPQLRGRPLQLVAEEEHSLLTDELGQRWQASEEDSTPPAFAAAKGGIEIRPNGASVRRGNETVTEPFTLAVGESAFIGMVPVRVAPVARVTVEVRNVFGHVASDTEEVVLTSAARAPTVRVAGRAGQ